MHLIKSRVDQIVRHLVHFSRPDIARDQAGLQIKPKDLDRPEDRNQQRDQQQVTHPLNSEPELHSRHVQAAHVDGEPSVFSPCRHPLPLAHDQVTEAATRDTERHIRLFPAELSDQDLDSFPSSTQDTVMEQADVSDGAGEETQDHACSSPVQMLTRRERNRLKSLRRKQRKKERWIQRQLEDKVVVRCCLTNIHVVQ